MELSLSGRVWVVDGGLATEMERRGHNINDDPLWSARLLKSDPQTIVDIHKSYLSSGADVIITSSYQASVGGFSTHLGISEDEACNLIGQSVTLAREACQWFTSQHKHKSPRPGPLVAGSVGPYGACQHDGSEYTGDYDHMTTQALKNWHRPRISLLLSSGVDILACETLPSLREAQTILQLLEEEFPTAKAWFTFTCKAQWNIKQNFTLTDALHTSHGELFSEVVTTLTQRSKKNRNIIVAVGINCSDPRLVEPLLKSATGCISDCPFIVYPNSGETWNGDSHEWLGERIDFTKETIKWIALGARAVGGCCRVGPEQIREIRATVDHTH